MSECRALTNMIGNSVAAIVVAKWEGQLDVEQARRVLNPAKAPAANSDERPVPEPVAA
jgi:aerobic C4-dicarboxylate transport protein